MRIEISTEKKYFNVSFEKEDEEKNKHDIFYELSVLLADATEDLIIHLFDSESIDQEQKMASIFLERTEIILLKKYNEVQNEIDRVMEAEKQHCIFLEKAYNSFKEKNNITDEEILVRFSQYKSNPENVEYRAIMDEDQDLIKVGIVDKKTKEFILVIDDLVLSEELKASNGTDRSNFAKATAVKVLRLVDEAAGKKFLEKPPLESFHQIMTTKK